ncbi:hypothetical protein CALVIDRAFT_520521 [Calocera viscosa TUFC12733]|uniref:Bromo domain-containing protein n=1 Tax=Calocera viscosa (strain TUFC12733) TaxID=1330018 RepID=A0A167I309_CALVF|nr:hypothetical protein CALVIDRAFT_520521 [Calocera viscosa TUFC12733]
MKNLLSAIASGSLGSSIKAANVKDILAEVQSYRDTKAADAFYETLERVLNELRATPEAVAFRNPVKKSEAPDYEDYIKTPMDMSTMLKKVKNRVYENKAQFAADLNLIWDNCLMYNSEPTHPLRRQAQLMRRKADHVLERINDRGEVSKPSKNGKIKPKMSAKDRDRERQLEKERMKMREREKKLEQTTKSAATTGGLGQSLSVLLALDAREAAQGEANAEQEAAAKAELENAKKDENGLVHLPQRTADSMARFLEIKQQWESEQDSRQAIAGPSNGFAIDGIVPKTEYPVIAPFGPINVFQPVHPISDPQPTRRRKRTLAEAFDSAQSEALAAVEKKRDERHLQNGHAPKGKGVGLRDELLRDWYGDLMKPEMVVAGVPELEDWVADNTAEMPARKKARMNGAAARRKKKKPVRKETLRSSIESNLQTLNEVRKIKDKLQKLADAKEAEEKGEEDVAMEEPLPDIPEQPADPPRSGYWLNPEDGIKNSSYMLLRHAGFEGSSKTALGVVNAVATEYIRNIGRTMRHFLDIHSGDMPPEEIVLHTLFENGVTEVNQLERYVRDDVQRYGGRLQEIARKLQTAYREQSEKELDEEDYDEEEDIVGGGLGDVLGVDFLGLGDLGLEGITSLSVPRRLLLGKPSKKAAAAAAAAAAKAKPAEKVLPYPKPAPFIPLTEDKIDKQIGLLHNFYKSKLLPMPSVTENGTDNGTKPQDSQTANGALNSPGGGLLPQPAVDESKSSTEIKRYVPEDPGNASKTKIGPKGEILLHAPAPSAKKKKGKSTTGSEAPMPLPLPPPPPPPPILPKVEDGRPSPAQTPVALAPSVAGSATPSVTASPTLEKRKAASQSPVHAPHIPAVAPPPQPPPGMMPHPAYPSVPLFPGYGPPLAPGAPPMWAAMYGAPPWMQPVPNGTVPPPPLPPDGLAAAQPMKPPAYSPPTRGVAPRGRGGPPGNAAARGGAARGGVANRARGGPPSRGAPPK